MNEFIVKHLIILSRAEYTEDKMSAIKRGRPSQIGTVDHAILEGLAVKLINLAA
jgi:hypothetical protein